MHSHRNRYVYKVQQSYSYEKTHADFRHTILRQYKQILLSLIERNTFCHGVIQTTESVFVICPTFARLRNTYSNCHIVLCHFL